jgi:hypothetical protein
MPNTVFFAWQLDTPSKENKAFIWNALVEAVGASGVGASAEESPRPEIDTQGMPGSPNIVETIFSRIRACSMFVADISLVGATPSGKRTPNANVLIELGFAARSVGWNRTILVMNRALGPARDLPFDILQHRWPIEYHLSDGTQVREKRYASLSTSLAAALSDCQAHSLVRAAEMADSLDTACLDFIAQNETKEIIDMPLPAKTMGQQLVGLEFNATVRRLMQLGALKVVSKPTVGYAWTYDGRLMIARLNDVQPTLLNVLREHRPAAQAI